jgi:hypothetical protein
MNTFGTESKTQPWLARQCAKHNPCFQGANLHPGRLQRFMLMPSLRPAICAEILLLLVHQ